MAEWCMAHPWLTFWVIILALIVLDTAIVNFARLCNNLMRMRVYEKTGVKAKLEEDECPARRVEYDRP